MRKKLFIVLVVVSFALTSPIYSSALSIASFSDFDVTCSSLLREYEVLLKSRRFVPTPGISRIARVKIERARSGNTQALSVHGGLTQP